jgi:hypothetical protein
MGHEAAGATLNETRERVAQPRFNSIQIVPRELLDKLDDTSPQAWLRYPHEGLGEREPVARGEEFGHIGGRRRRSVSLGVAR